jgi:hypothetical protein
VNGSGSDLSVNQGKEVKMISEDVAVKSIKQSLEMLRSRIKTLMPTTLCHIGETVMHDARQIHASFLKVSVQAVKT